MTDEVTIAIVGAFATIVAAIVGGVAAAIAATKKENRKFSNELREQFAVTKLKADTLWEIYAVQAMEDARRHGMVARQSAVKPTKEWELAISMELSLEIQSDAKKMACVLPNPYDIAIELWTKYSDLLVRASRNRAEEIGFDAYWGTLLIICQNAVANVDAENDC